MRTGTTSPLEDRQPQPDVAAAVTRVVTANGDPRLGLRVAEPHDEATVLELLDDAVRRLNRRGITEQWGTEPFSQSARRREQVRSWVAAGSTVLAIQEDLPLGALVLGEAPDYVPTATLPEVYVALLVSSGHRSGWGVGRALLHVAERVARLMEVARLRVDCYAGGDQGLVRYYKSAGFTPVHSFHVGDWPGQVLEQAIRPTDVADERPR